MSKGDMHRDYLLYIISKHKDKNKLEDLYLESEQLSNLIYQEFEIMLFDVRKKFAFYDSYESNGGKGDQDIRELASMEKIIPHADKFVKLFEETQSLALSEVIRNHVICSLQDKMSINFNICINFFGYITIRMN